MAASCSSSRCSSKRRAVASSPSANFRASTNSVSRASIRFSVSSTRCWARASSSVFSFTWASSDPCSAARSFTNSASLCCFSPASMSFCWFNAISISAILAIFSSALFASSSDLSAMRSCSSRSTSLRFLSASRRSSSSILALWSTCPLRDCSCFSTSALPIAASLTWSCSVRNRSVCFCISWAPLVCWLVNSSLCCCCNASSCCRRDSYSAPDRSNASPKICVAASCAIFSFNPHGPRPAARASLTTWATSFPSC
mmetsp:Transcript_70271/g.187155  ORF Transcript_70271/g.187155 Transcript_70271/m.187155 type:complete len:256 (-) Transcript_70271:622-1389(-)